MSSVDQASYITFPIDLDPRDLMAKAFAYMQANFPGWTPSEGQLDTAMIEAIAGEAADIGMLTSRVPKSIFRYFGATLIGIPPIDATPATVNTTWTLTDALGHTIAAGTQVGIRNALGDLIPFQVLVDVVVPGGSNITQVGQVVLVAVNPGAAASDLGGVATNVELIDSINWVSSIEQTGPTSGGVDAETDDDYLDRLNLELQTMAPRPILPQDFAVLARNVSGVQRATAIDGYNPGDGTTNNERMVTVVAVDASGNAVSGAVKTAISEYLEALREVNFVVNTTDPTYSNVDVTVHVRVAPGYDPDVVASTITAALQSFLDPTVWGISRTDNPNLPKTWNNSSIVRYLDLATLVKTTPGVDIIDLIQIGLNGGAQIEDDVTLTGIAPLPRSGALTVVAS